MAEIGNVTVRVDAVITDEQYREAMSAVRAANERMDLLEAENAKLRELCADMAAEMRGLGVDFKRVGWCDYADRMRELGVDA